MYVFKRPALSECNSPRSAGIYMDTPPRLVVVGDDHRVPCLYTYTRNQTANHGRRNEKRIQTIFICIFRCVSARFQRVRLFGSLFGQFSAHCFRSHRSEGSRAPRNHDGVSPKSYAIYVYYTSVYSVYKHTHHRETIQLPPNKNTNIKHARLDLMTVQPHMCDVCWVCG